MLSELNKYDKEQEKQKVTIKWSDTWAQGSQAENGTVILKYIRNPFKILNRYLVHGWHFYMSLYQGGMGKDGCECVGSGQCENQVSNFEIDILQSTNSFGMLPEQ